MVRPNLKYLNFLRAHLVFGINSIDESYKQLCLVTQTKFSDNHYLREKCSFFSTLFILGRTTLGRKE